MEVDVPRNVDVLDKTARGTRETEQQRLGQERERVQVEVGPDLAVENKRLPGFRYLRDVNYMDSERDETTHPAQPHKLAEGLVPSHPLVPRG